MLGLYTSYTSHVKTQIDANFTTQVNGFSHLVELYATKSTFPLKSLFRHPFLLWSAQFTTFSQ
jgi:hypothetical protein